MPELRPSSLAHAECSDIPGDAGIMVSGCYSSAGESYMWGANTNSQLGRGDASALLLHAFCLSLQTPAYICIYLQVQACSLMLIAICVGRIAFTLMSFCIAAPFPPDKDGNIPDPDQIVPLKLKETKRFKNRQVIGVEIGGQMTFILSKPRPETVAVTDHEAGHTPPEPAPADMQA